jgi:hypothetical protein
MQRPLDVVFANRETWQVHRECFSCLETTGFRFVFTYGQSMGVFREIA